VLDIWAYHPELAVLGAAAGLGAGILTHLHRRVAPVVVALAPAGFALVVIAAGEDAEWWRSAALALVVTAAASAVPWWPADAPDPRPLLVISTAGVWYSVPDTEAIVTVGGAVVALAATTRRPPGRSWLALAALIGLAAWWGARARMPVLVGVSAMAGALVLVPALRPFKAPPGPVAVAVAHLACVAIGTYAARELRHDVGLAWAAVAAAYAIGAAVLVLAPRPRDPDRAVGSDLAPPTTGRVGA
jgi:hypothetical protein